MTLSLAPSTKSTATAQIRIAVIQHGDYAEALALRSGGKPEPYFCMYYSLDVLGDLLDTHPHIVLSLNAPAAQQPHGHGTLIGAPAPHWPKFVPGRIPASIWARQIRHQLAEFNPTHVLLRTGDPVIACAVLEFCQARRASALVIFANIVTLNGASPRTRRMIELLNEPFVFLVGNHKQIATQSLIDAGVAPQKTAAWDWPNARHPRDFSPKELAPNQSITIAYVGQVSEPKGVTDLFDAVILLHKHGRKITLQIAGDGPQLDPLRRRAAEFPAGLIQLLGRIGNQEAFDLMRRSTLVCVPSRHEFPEGMPLTLTEALASRTPVIVSDHPIMARAFIDNEGLRFFRAADPINLADTITAVLDSPTIYAQLSHSTAAAFARVECPTTFADLIHRWQKTFPPSKSPSPLT